MSEQKKLLSAREADAEIQRLEGILGLPHGPMRTRVSEFNSRISELTAMVGLLKGAAPVAGKAPSPVHSPVHSPRANPPATSGTLTRAQLFGVAAVFPMLTLEQDIAHGELRGAVARAAWLGYHEIPGLTDDAALVGKLWRADKSPGIGNYMRALRQAKIEAILAK